MSDEIIIYLIMGAAIILAVGGVIIDGYRSCYSKPKFRRGPDGFVEYKSMRFKPTWKKVCIWVHDEEERTVKIHDTIRNRVYDVKYNGPGRAYLRYDNDGWKNYMADFKRIKDLELNQEKLIDDENEIIKGCTLKPTF